ncbi:NB-ARC domain-containing protein [Mycena chlorophos]|uniref:NB-ARC domain-containing protein n=1 Tax=Mycena chlorophos TaxID=658473 RepID=A0A8H6TH26_MYCCL|nr:NB-ARC domain-containing protein [Mycena chlorophos]
MLALATMESATFIRPRLLSSNEPPATASVSWLDQLLATAQNLQPPHNFPVAQGTFDAIVELLQIMKNVKDPQDLKDLCEAIVETAAMLHSLPDEAQRGNWSFKCNKFREILRKIQGKVKKMPQIRSTIKQRVQQWFRRQPSAGKFQKYKEEVFAIKHGFAELVPIQTVLVELGGGLGGTGGEGHQGGTGGIGEGAQATVHTVNTIFYGHRTEKRMSVEEQIFSGCPPPSDFFIGRQDILQQLESYFHPTSPQKQIVVLLYGLGGVGKTQIALKFISDHLDLQVFDLTKSIITDIVQIFRAVQG